MLSIEPTPSENTQTFELPWETLDGLINGTSAVDAQTLALTGPEEAIAFLANYGFDIRNGDDAEALRVYMREAVRFIETHMLSHAVVDWSDVREPASPAYYIPTHLTDHEDPVQLLLTAALGSGEDRLWAGAILKVMHTLCHIDYSPVIRYYDEAREQILQRFEENLHRDDATGTIYLGSPDESHRLRIYGFETKDYKSRDSILIKVLSKKGHVAERLQDLLGVRIITFTPPEAILALDLLRKLKVIVSPNILANRCRNSLVDFDAFQREFHQTFGDTPPTHWDELQTRVQQFDLPFPDSDYRQYNKVSSKAYRSLHVTCRHLIRVDDHMSQSSLTYGPVKTPAQRMFYPYEIQLVDQANYLDSQEGGSSSHRLYKQRQLILARRRVLGQLLTYEIIPNPEPFITG